MADRTSAAIFGRQFERLAKGRIPERKLKEAREVWRDSWNYDFNPYQMGCDEALLRLGLAQDRGEEGMFYKESDGVTWEEP
jgi:hypothetical protein